MPAPRQGTGFVNFADFVNANRSGAQRVASALQQPYLTDLQRADGSLRSAQDEFSRDVEAGTFNGDTSRQRTAAELGEANAYTGPEGLAGNQNYDVGVGLANRANDGASRLSDIYGRMGLLRDFYGSKNPTYTTGQQTFDSALLGGVGQKGFEATQKNASGMLERFASANTAAQQRASDARAQGRAAQQSYLGSMQQRAGGYYGYGGYGPPVAPPSTTPRQADPLGQVYVDRNNPGYLNAGDPRIKKKGGG